MGSSVAKPTTPAAAAAPKSADLVNLGLAGLTSSDIRAFKNSILLMNMEDSSTEDYQLEYLPLMNMEGTSLGIQQLFGKQMNPAFVDAEALQQLAFGNDKAYIAQPAKAKLAQLWSKCAADQTSAEPMSPAKLFTYSMPKSFTSPGDTFPAGLVTSREKLIHRIGAVGKAKFISNGKHGYTGLLDGAEHALVRFSSALPPSGEAPTLIPGMGLKFLRDGMDSGNLVAMFSTAGQPEWNFFEHDWHTWIPETKTDKAGALLGCKFATASKITGMVGVSELASFDSAGKAVRSPKHPWALNFSPKPALKGLYKKLHGTEDFVANMEYLDLLKAIPAGSELFDVYAEDTPTAKQVLLGTLKLDGKVVTSKFGDEKLFFRHQKMDDDLKSRPELKAVTKSFKCPYAPSLWNKGEE